MNAFLKTLRSEIENQPNYYNGMKVCTIEPTAFKTTMLGFDAMRNALNRTWGGTSNGVKLAYKPYIFDGIMMFIKTWQLLEPFDFMFVDSDLSKVSKEILKALTAQHPEKNNRVMGIPTRSVAWMLFYYLPAEILEYSYRIVILGMYIYSWQLDKVMKVLKACHMFIIKKTSIEN